jgi:hypothetical protein
VTSYAEACVDQNRSSCCCLVLLPLADRLQAVGWGRDNGGLSACLPVPQGSSGPLCLAEMPGNPKSLEINTKTNCNKTRLRK